MSRLNQIHALNRRLLRARFLPEPLLAVMGEDDWSGTPISKSAKLRGQNGTFIYIDVPISWLELLIKIDDQGRLDFSRKALLEKPEGYVERPKKPRNDNNRNKKPFKKRRF